MRKSQGKGIQMGTEQSFHWLQHGIRAVCALISLAALFLVALGAYRFNFGASRDVVLGGLDSMSDGILAALIGVTIYILFFGIGVLLANLLKADAPHQTDAPKHA
jgi:hypothetical protein